MVDHFPQDQVHHVFDVEVRVSQFQIDAVGSVTPDPGAVDPVDEALADCAVVEVILLGKVGLCLHLNICQHLLLVPLSLEFLIVDC